MGFALQSGDRPELRAATDKMIDEIVAVQEPSGYLNTYYVERSQVPSGCSPETQTTGHELYNIGHMLQGAIAYYRATGDRKLLDAGIRFVNDFLMSELWSRAQEADRFRTSGDRNGADRALPHHRRQAATRSRRLHPAGRRARKVSRTPHHLHVQRHAVYRAHQTGRPCRARHVCLLRRDRLLHGNRRSRLLEDAEHALGRPDRNARCTSPAAWARAPKAKLLAMPTNCPMRALMAKAAPPSAT